MYKKVQSIYFPNALTQEIKNKEMRNNVHENRPRTT